MAKLSDCTSAADRLVGNCALNSGAAAIGGTATAFSTTAAIAYLVDGTMRSIGAQTNTALSPLVAADLPAATGASYLQPSGVPGFVTQPAATTVYYVLGANAAGTVRVVQGTWAGQPVSMPNGVPVVGSGAVPDVPDGFTPFAIMKVVTAGSAFVPGTTSLTGIATFLNISVLPAAGKP